MNADTFQRSLPEGWTYTPRVPEKCCSTCGHIEEERTGELVSPSGERVPLVGNRSAAQERQMVKAIIESRTR